MASVETVKQYLAYWFQLGKKVVSSKTAECLFPDIVFTGSFYSREFDECWQKIIRFEGKDYYLEGTTQTISQLLTPIWDIIPCATCSMPVPKINLGVQPMGCPCDNLNNWPNNELPFPRKAIDSKLHLQSLRSRLGQNDRLN
jgi:hypothetical protein